MKRKKIIKSEVRPFVANNLISKLRIKKLEKKKVSK